VRKRPVLLVTGALCALLTGALAAQEPPVSAADLKTAIDQLGTLDFTTRMNASRTVRRATPSQAVPALIEAATGHADGYVRYRALVLLSGFNDPRTPSVVLSLMDDANDRIRSTAYTFFEHNRTEAALGPMMKALSKEESEFVRPELTRALAAHGDKPAVQEAMRGLIMRGQNLFRSVAIEALGDRKAAYALPDLTRVAGMDGPLQDDAVLALGKIGDRRSLSLFAELQRTAAREVQPTIAAAICLIGVNCASHESYLIETVRFSISTIGFQELLRPAVAGMAALAVQGREPMLQAMIEFGAPARDPARAPIALGIGTVALKNPKIILALLERQPDPAPAIALLREAFDMFEEDYEEEQFFATVRRAYWSAGENTPAQRAAGMLIRQLEF
jgi:HEAT repeat protein